MLRLPDFVKLVSLSSGRRRQTLRSRRLQSVLSNAAAQPLEIRNLLAGNVLAVVNAGDLILVGDNQANLVDVVVVDGDIVVRGRDNTTINGSTDAFVAVADSASLGDDLFVRLGQGDDVLFVEGISIGGNAVVSASAGNDSVGFQGTTIGRNMVVSSTSGSDIVNLDEVSVGRNLRISTGKHSDTIQLVTTTVGRNVAINSGRHDDTVILDTTSVLGSVNVWTGAGADNVVMQDSTVGRQLHAVTGRGSDFVMLDATTVGGQARIATRAQFDRVVVDNSSQLGSLIINAGRGQDAVQVDSSTVIGGRQKVHSAGSSVVTDAAVEFELNDSVSGALTLGSQAATLFANLATSTGPLSLSVDTSANTTTTSNNTLITSDPTFALQVATQAGATVAVDSDGDGLFDDGTTTADSSGSATLNVTLTNTDANGGDNNLNVQVSNGTEDPLTEAVRVHYAEGTVVRFDSSLGSWDLELFDEDAPNTVAAFLQDLSRYDDSIVHRNVDGFIVQGGGFRVNGTTVENVTSFTAPPNEFDAASPPNSNLRGTISTAQNSNINSFTGQWFFNTIDNDATSSVNNLDAVPHTVFGRIIGDGLTIIDTINNTPDFNVSSLLTGSGAFALTDVPLVNYTAGNVPTSANFITINSATQLSPAANVGNTFSVFENTATGTSVGTVTAAVTGSPVVYQFANTTQPSELNLNPDDHLEGTLNSPVVLVEYISLQCPSCATAHPIVQQLLADNAGDVIVVRRHLPLDTATGGFFEHAFEAALASEAAARQGQFDEMVTELFERQSEWTNSATSAEAQAVFEDIAVNTLGLNLTEFRTDIADPDLTDRINRDIADASVLGATGTPTFYLNGTQTSGTPTTADVQSALQSLAPAFALDRRSGELSVFDSAALDFETTPTFPLSITATGTNTTTVSAAVNLIDGFGV